MAVGLLSTNRDRLPPAPPLPRIVQMMGFLASGDRFLDWCQRNYGPAVSLRTYFDDGFVMVFDPELVKQIFQASPEQLHAGEANVMLGPLLGRRSVLLLDGAEHLRHRRLLLPPFHGERMRSWTDVIRASADAEIDAWPVGREFRLLESMQALTLRVIVRAVFGYAGAEAEEVSARLRAMIAPLAQPRSLILAAIAGRIRGRDGIPSGFAERRAGVDELLFAEITRRRRDPNLAAREDVFSALLLAEDEQGQPLSDQEVRDELLTLLLAGHETTATALAWAFDLLLHSPSLLAHARNRDDRYLDAVAKEALRIRPVIPGVGRIVRGEPFRLGGWEIPVGMEINPSIRTIHRRADLYPDPERFRPERFLGDDAPDTYAWLPFGGGTRRCIGASFALMEMRLVLDRVLERVGHRLQAATRRLEPAQLRVITLAPRNGVRVRLRVQR
jgi:cytochrome P450 family 135